MRVPEAVPYSWHPDGSVRRVVFLHMVGNEEVNKTVTITPATKGAGQPCPLPWPPSIKIDQGLSQWVFSTDHESNLGEWKVWNEGALATRQMKTRLKNEFNNRCDFGISVFETLWCGKRVRLEIRLTACQPVDPKARNWPLTGGVFLDTVEIMKKLGRGKIGDQMCVWHRDDTIHYAVCNEWSGHACGSNGVDYTKVTGGRVDEVLKAAASHKEKPWFHAEWGHPLSGPSTGLHGEFGVCRVDIADGVQKKSEAVWPALHGLCTEWLSSPYHLIDADGRVQKHPLDYPNSWSTVLAQPDRYKHPYPIYGKAKDAEPPDNKGRTPEDNAHIRSHALSCVLEFAPTPLYLEEVTTFRAQAILNLYGGEERAYARTNATALEIVPFVRGKLREDLLEFISRRMRYQIEEHKKVGYRSPRQDGPRENWIPGKKVFLPWQTGMMFGSFWAAHLSGYEKLRLTPDEINTVKLTMLWLVDNTWRQLQDGSWQHAYATAVDLSQHAWGDGGIAGQGMAGLEAIANTPKAAQILAWARGQGERDRWYPQRP